MSRMSLRCTAVLAVAAVVALAPSVAATAAAPTVTPAALAPPLALAPAAVAPAAHAPAAHAPDRAARTARVRVAGVVYRAVVPLAELGVEAPDAFTSLAERVADRASVPARPTTVALLGDTPVFQSATPGRVVTAARVLDGLRQSLVVHRVVTVPLTPVGPPAETAGTRSVIVVHAGDNRLYLYQDHVLTRTFPVATGSPDFPTPKGRFAIQVMRRAPTWINPHPTTGWGLTMPAVIPPGPTNPLGLRAMNLTAPNIRIHGTPQDRSVGYSVSHGCVRMHNSDVVQLFDLVGVGATVFIVQTAAPRLPPRGSGIPTAIDPTLGG